MRRALTPAEDAASRCHEAPARVDAERTRVSVLDHHLGGIMLGLDRVGGFLEAIAALEPKKIKSDKFQYPKSLSDPDWDGSISINTYTDYSALYGPFTVHKYREWDSGTDIYATDADTGKDLMGYIVQCMRASGATGVSCSTRSTTTAGARTSASAKWTRSRPTTRVPCPSWQVLSRKWRGCTRRRGGTRNIARDYGDGAVGSYGCGRRGRVRETRVAEIGSQARLIVATCVKFTPGVGDSTSLSGTKIDFRHKGHVALTASHWSTQSAWKTASTVGLSTDHFLPISRCTRGSTALALQ